jgi:hypothetical protein
MLLIFGPLVNSGPLKERLAAVLDEGDQKVGRYHLFHGLIVWVLPKCIRQVAAHAKSAQARVP